MSKRWHRRVARTIVWTLGIFIILCLLFDHFVQFRKSDQELLDFFAKYEVPGSIHYASNPSRKIRYMVIGADTLPTLFFIHGSPSSMSIYEKYFTDTFLLHRFRMVAVDRPGYGGSGFGRPEPSVQKQAQLLLPILRNTKNSRRSCMIIAGSYGTSVACRMMMEDPGVADGMLLIAPSLAPGEEKVFWFTHIIETPLIRWFIPRMFQSANTEKIHHKAELEKMVSLWSRIKVPIFYLQGANDQLIYTSNAVFAQKKLINTPYLHIEFLKGRPHFFAFSDSRIIRKKMIDLYEYLTKHANQQIK